MLTQLTKTSLGHPLEFKETVYVEAAQQAREKTRTKKREKTVLVSVEYLQESSIFC